MPASSPRPRRARRAASCAIVAASALGLGTLGTPVGAAKAPKPVVQVPVGDLTVYRTGNDPQTLPDDVRDKVMATITSYLNGAAVKPLKTGMADPVALTAALTAAAAARLTGPDRAVLLDEGLPPAVSKISVTAAPVALTGLADGQGKVVLVTAKLDATTTTKTAKGKLVIKRTGEIVLTPDAGTWKIDGYSLTVDRVGKGLGAGATTTTTTPAAATPGPVAK